MADVRIKHLDTWLLMLTNYTLENTYIDINF